MKDNNVGQPVTEAEIARFLKERLCV